MICIKRSPIIPASLLEKKGYRGLDVLEAFDNDFFFKCYLSEYKAPHNSHEFEVDHFIQQNENIELKYEWTNLYPIKPSIHKIKPKKTPTEGYLDPCKDNVEEEIIYHYSGVIDIQIKFFAKDNLNIKAKNTVELLDIIHNGKNDERSKFNAFNIKADIQKRAKEIIKLIIELNKNENDIDKIEELKSLLSRKSAYTMLMRSMSVVRNNVPKDWFD
jgi:hypothetical protein